MDDLISRKALLKELREIMDEPHNTMFLMGIGAAISVIEHADTAFDKEKVIEELKTRTNGSFFFSDWCESEELFGRAMGYKNAIKIVEKGGIE